ncbi:MAG: TVP38/TMEM64 family protein [Actinomycetota bacterium]|nr:TVP38/TMEM64 family protein [Actinomycetota bacterium]
MSGRTALFAALGLVVVLVAIGFLVPIPSPADLRTWAAGAGWAGPLVFLAVYTAFTVIPIPRTVFTLSAGLLLGEVVGLVVAMAATTLAATIAFSLARGAGRRWLEAHLDRENVRAVNVRLTRGGVTAVMSLRLIPLLPFAPVNYCCGLSAIAFRPYLMGTVLGCLPGTAAAVFLGDALTGTTPPALVAVYIALAGIGALGLYTVVRPVKQEQTA